MKRVIAFLFIFSVIKALAFGGPSVNMDTLRNESAKQIQLLKNDGWIIDNITENLIHELYKQVGEGSAYFIGCYNSPLNDNLTDEEIKEEMEGRLFMSISSYLEEYIGDNNLESGKDIDWDRMEECITNTIEEEFPQIVATPFIVLKTRKDDKSLFNYYLLSPEKVNSIVESIYKRYIAFYQ